jgi:Tol biopolymer transport system component
VETFSLGLSVYGGCAPQRVSTVGVNSAWAAVSPKGNRLVFSRTMSDSNIWRLPLETETRSREPERFISSTLDDTAAQYSPDGRKVVFTSARSGAIEIWVCDSDGSNPVQLTSFGRGMTGSPHWSPDSKQIVFDGNAEGQFEIY